MLWASGAAFTAVVAGQMASAFACRSASVSPGKLGWLSNRYLVVAVVCEGAMLMAFLYITIQGENQRQDPPSVTIARMAQAAPARSKVNLLICCSRPFCDCEEASQLTIASVPVMLTSHVWNVRRPDVAWFSCTTRALYANR